MDFKPKIKVSIEIYPGDIYTVCKELGFNIVEEVFQKIDFSSTDADPFIRNFICTSQPKIERIIKSREEISDIISKEITKALLDIIGSKDTKMGYKLNKFKNGG